MPLHDHFHPPLSEQRPWESFHSTWCTTLADYLNRELLPSGYVALEQVHAGAAIEIDVAAYQEESPTQGGVATTTQTVWTPATAPVTIEAEYLQQFAVEIHSTEGGRTLVAAIELVSPGNKDRDSKRRLFAAKCASQLARGVGLVVVDIVSSRKANLHNEIMDLLETNADSRMDDALYAVGYRPLNRNGDGWIECWPQSLAVGEALPAVALSLSAECCLRVELEDAYADACRRRRVGEVVG